MDTEQINLLSDVDMQQLNKAFLNVKIEAEGSTQTLVDNQQLAALYNAAYAYAEQIKMKELTESHEAYLRGELKTVPFEEVVARLKSKYDK